MDLLDSLLGHDAWTTREMLLRSQRLTDEQLDRQFPIGPGSLRATFAHIIWNMEAWTDAISERPLRPRPGADAKTIPAMLRRLDAAAADFAAVARKIRDAGRYDDCFTAPDSSPPLKHTFGGTIAHLITHSMHHRAQVLNMMRHLGMDDLIEGDVLSWERATGVVRS
jgi:uncharacterized damage-inducible protein DinB